MPRGSYKMSAVWKQSQTGGDAVITGWKNKLQVAMAKVLPVIMVAEKHRRQTEPGSAANTKPQLTYENGGV